MFTQSSFGKMWVQIHLISSTSYMIVFTPPSQTPELLYKYQYAYWYSSEFCNLIREACPSFIIFISRRVPTKYFFDDILQHCKRQAVLLQKTSKEMTSLFLLLFSTVLEMACRFRKYLGQLYLFCQGLLVYKVLQQQITWMAVIFIPFVQANISAKVWEKIKSVEYYLHFTWLV